MSDQRNSRRGAASAAPTGSDRLEQDVDNCYWPPVRQRRRPPQPSGSDRSSEPGARPTDTGPGQHRSPQGDADQPTRHNEAAAYEVGYGRPPIHTRFKPGQSGNPKGRPKGRKNTRTIFEEEMNAKVRVTENGRQVTMTKREALLKRLINDGIKGDARARAEVTRLDLQFSIETSPPSANDNAAAAEELPPEAEPMLAYLERVILEKAGLSPVASTEAQPSDDGKRQQVSPSATKRGSRSGAGEGS